MALGCSSGGTGRTPGTAGSSARSRQRGRDGQRGRDRVAPGRTGSAGTTGDAGATGAGGSIDTARHHRQRGNGHARRRGGDDRAPPERPARAGRGGTTGAGGTTSACTTTGTGGTAAPPTCTSNPADYTYPFQDPCRPIEDRITNLLSVLTVPEKLGLMNEYQLPVDRLGIKAYTTFVEGVHGIGWSGDPATPASSASTNVLYLTGTQFPQAYGLAESWDPEALRTVGMTTGYEARVWNAAKPPNAQGRGVGLVVRAPLVDLGRDPRWGRTEEGYGEDPFLTAALANGYIAGLHGTDPVYLQAASTLKHWLGNNNETNRNTSSSNIDDRNLREYYGYPFEQAIRIGKAKGMMSAYNKLAGTSSAVSPLLKSLVIGEWGFDGTLCTDAWGPQVLVNDQMAYANLPAAMAAIIKGGTGLILQDQADARPAVMTAYSGGMITRGRHRRRLAREPARPLSPGRLRSAGAGAVQEHLGHGDAVEHGRIQDARAGRRAQDASCCSRTRRTRCRWPRPDSPPPRSSGRAPTRCCATGTAAWRPTRSPAARGSRPSSARGVTVVYAADNNGNAATSAAMTAATAGGPAIVFVGNHPTCGNAPPEPNPAPWAHCPTAYEGREAVDRAR